MSWLPDITPLFHLAMVGLVAIGLVLFVGVPLLIWWLVTHVTIGWAI